MSATGNKPAFPAGFESLSDINEMSEKRLKSQPLVNVYGVITDLQQPMKTRNDWKCTIEIIDDTFPSLGNKYGMKVNFFAHGEAQLPRFAGLRSVVRLESIKVQMYAGAISLLSHHNTRTWSLNAEDLRKGSPTAIAYAHNLKESDISYAIWLNSSVQDSLALPSSTEYQQRTEQSLNRREKYSPLKDVEADRFYDLVGEVLHKFDHGDKVTIWVSDYTANKLFYDKTPSNSRSPSIGQDGDQYGYTSGFRESGWPGPNGKMSIQLTLYDAGRSALDFNIGQWVFIHNCQVRLDKNNVYLEGRLHCGPQNTGHITVIDKHQDRVDIDPRYKDGLRNKKTYESRISKKESNLSVGTKHGLETTSKEPNKKKRKKERAERAAAQKKLAEERDTVSELNSLIKCNHPDQQPRRLAEILVYETKEEWGPVPPTFLNRKFRANVRVVNFFPDRLEEFATGRYISDYDILSDHSDDDDTASEEDTRKSGGTKEWEWQFSLKVEDVGLPNDPTPRKSIWVLLDNSNAQCLLDLDADDLCENEELLMRLRRQLEILWGDLEERKSALLEKLQELNSSESRDPTNKGKEIATLKDVAAPYPEDENTARAASSKSNGLPLVDRDINLQSTAIQQTKDGLIEEFNRDPQVKNKAFTCCIQEYGVKNEFTGKTDVRQFNIFGTRIAGDL